MHKPAINSDPRIGSVLPEEEASRKGAAAVSARGPVPEQLPGSAEAHALIRAGHRDPALVALKKLAARDPASAYVRYLEGTVNFDNLR